MSSAFHLPMTPSSFRNACKSAIGPARSGCYLLFFFSSLRLISRRSVIGRERRKTLTAVAYLYIRRRRNTIVSAADRRESGDSTNPAATRRDQLFPPRSERKPSTSCALRLFFREFYTSHPEVHIEFLCIRVLAPLIIKLLYVPTLPYLTSAAAISFRAHIIEVLWRYLNDS